MTYNFLDVHPKFFRQRAFSQRLLRDPRQTGRIRPATQRDND